MRFNKLDLNLLVALNALLTESSISRAAESVHLSQSAMSNALARLRDYFDDELLVQVGRRMELTHRAHSLKEPVRDVLLRVETTVAIQPMFDPQNSDRVFRLTVSDYTSAVLMPRLLQCVHQQSSRVRFKFLPQTSNPKHALENGDVDLLVIPELFSSAAHPSELLFTESFCCLVCKNSPLAHEELTLERYLAHGHVVMEPPNAYAYETKLLASHGIERRVEVTTFSFATASRLIVGTSRIATLHKRLARQAEQELPVVARSLPVNITPMKQMMQWHKYRTNDLGLVWLRKTIQQAVNEMDNANS